MFVIRPEVRFSYGLAHPSEPMISSSYGPTGESSYRTRIIWARPPFHCGASLTRARAEGCTVPEGLYEPGGRPWRIGSSSVDLSGLSSLVKR